MMAFTEAQLERYSRHIILADVGGEGQQKLLASRVLIIGAGGLGSPVALYLAAAGVGTIGIVDQDRVELSNLQRQVIHFTDDVGQPKVVSAKDKMGRINPDVQVIAYHERFQADNALEMMEKYDFIIDGTDNFSTKFLINDACVLAKKPYSHGGILRFEGQALTYTPGTLCYRCVFHDLPPKNGVPTCSQAGILGSVAGILGTIQATEAIKHSLGVGELLVNQLLTFDAKTMRFRHVSIPINAHCSVCSDQPTITQLRDYEPPVCDSKRSV